MTAVVVTEDDLWRGQVVLYNPKPGVSPIQPDLARPIDVTGFTALLQVRPGPGVTPVIDLSSADDGIVVGDIDGRFDWEVSLVGVPPGVYLWELEVRGPGDPAPTTVVPAATFRVRAQVAVAV